MSLAHPKKKNPFDGFTVGLYVFGYGLVPFLHRVFREPDAMDLFWDSIRWVKVLCILMMLAGIAIILWRRQVAARASEGGQHGQAFSHYRGGGGGAGGGSTAAEAKRNDPSLDVTICRWADLSPMPPVRLHIISAT